MSICDPELQNSNDDEANDLELQQACNRKPHFMHQKLIIKHCRLKKLSLWGCSGLDVRIFDILVSFSFLVPHMVLSIYIQMQALCLNCPELDDLNLNTCRNLRPGIYYRTLYL